MITQVKMTPTDCPRVTRMLGFLFIFPSPLVRPPFVDAFGEPVEILESGTRVVEAGEVVKMAAVGNRQARRAPAGKKHPGTFAYWASVAGVRRNCSYGRAACYSRRRRSAITGIPLLPFRARIVAEVVHADGKAERVYAEEAER